MLGDPYGWAVTALLLASGDGFFICTILAAVLGAVFVVCVRQGLGRLRAHVRDVGWGGDRGGHSVVDDALQKTMIFNNNNTWLTFVLSTARILNNLKFYIINEFQLPGASTSGCPHFGRTWLFL